MLTNVKRLVKSWRKGKSHTIVNPVIQGKDVQSGHYVRVLAITRYPLVIVAGYLDQLDKIVSKEGAVLRKTIRYAPSTVKWNLSMKYKLKRLEKSISAATVHDPARKAEKDAYDTIITLRDSELSSNHKLMDVWTFLTLSAPKQFQLDAAAKAVATWLDHMEGELDTLHREQLEALRQTSPLYDPETKSGQFFSKHHYGRVTVDSAAARTYPMTQGSFSQRKGIFFGRRSEDGGFRFIDLCNPNDPAAQNVTVFGKTGEGKSFFMKALVVSLLEEGVHVFVFDLDGEWRDLCEEVGGIYIDHTADNGRYFDPMTILPPLPEIDIDCVEYNRSRLLQATLSTVRTFSLLADGMSKGETFQLGEAIAEVHRQAGINPDDASTWNAPYRGEKPSIHRVFAELQMRMEAGHKAAESLVENVQIYFVGIWKHIFRYEESLEFHRAPLVVYKVGAGTSDDDEGKDERAKQAQLKMSMAFDVVGGNIQVLKYEGITFSAVLVDEGQRQLLNLELRSAVFSWYTAIRKWNGMMILGSNTPAIMLDTAQGVGMWENTSVRVYFYMESSAIRKLASHSDIPPEIQERIKQNAQSRKYILEVHHAYDELFMDVPSDESRLYKTRGLKKGGPAA